MAILVDDQLALVAALGLLDLPATFHSGPASTTYGFQVRLLSAASDQRPGRPTSSPLKRILKLAESDGRDAAAVLTRIVRPNPDLLRLINPLETAQRTAAIRESHRVSLLIAESLAAATYLSAPLLFTRANVGRHLEAACAALEVELIVGEIVADDQGLIGVQVDIQLD